MAEVRGSPAVAGQRCPVKQMALSVQVLGSDAVALGSESSLATRGRGSLEPFRKSESGSAVWCRQGHHCSHSPAVTRAAHPERTLPLWGGSYYVVPTSQGGQGGRGDGTQSVAEAGFKPRQWNQSPEKRGEGLGAWGLGHWRQSYPAPGLALLQLRDLGRRRQENSSCSPGGGDATFGQSVNLGAGGLGGRCWQLASR